MDCIPSIDGRCGMNAPHEPTKTKSAAPDQESAPFATNSSKHTADHDENKLYSTLQAKFALAGHTLYRTANADGSILYLAGKWGYFREIKGLEAVAAFLSIIGGAR
jgi:hypothetical protein